MVGPGRIYRDVAVVSFGEGVVTYEEKLGEAWAKAAPQSLAIAPGVVLLTDQRLERMRYGHAEHILFEYGHRHQAYAYNYPSHAEPIDVCFDKAYEFAAGSSGLLTYCEGFLCASDGSWLLAHAWCETKDRRIVDPTLWKTQHLRELYYYGIRFHLPYVTEWYRKQGHVGLLDGQREGKREGVHHDPAYLWVASHG